MSEPLEVLLLCRRPVSNGEAATVIDHLDAFGVWSRHRVREISFLRALPARLDLSRFDVLIIHYTLAIPFGVEHFFDEAAVESIRRFPGLKVQFLQDEYRNIPRIINFLGTVGIDILCTCHLPSEVEKVYPTPRLPKLKKTNTLTGYVPPALLERRVPPVASRPIDIGYRARKPPVWIGRLGMEKWQIADRLLRHPQAKGLVLDLCYAESDRLYGEAWVRFVTSCKALLGVESGASVVDLDDKLRPAVEAFQRDHPKLEEEEVYTRLVAKHEGNLRMNQVSPRCFEAAALRTPMVLLEGKYSGALEPWRHFVPLKADLSNMKEVTDTLRDHQFLQQLADRTYTEIACDPRYAYETFVRDFDKNIELEFAERRKVCVSNPYTRLGLVGALLASFRYVLRNTVMRWVHHMFFGTRVRHVLFFGWGLLPERTRQYIRPIVRLMGK